MFILLTNKTLKTTTLNLVIKSCLKLHQLAPCTNLLAASLYKSTCHLQLAISLIQNNVLTTQFRQTGCLKRTSILFLPTFWSPSKKMFKAKSRRKEGSVLTKMPNVAPKKQKWALAKQSSGWVETNCSLGFGLVTFHVERQVIGTSEASLADLALEWLGSRVLSYVASQFIRSCKAPLTTLEVAFVRFLT